jgi:aryl-alcohol dehydrogenase-like predicted oxidoreductase
MAHSTLATLKGLGPHAVAWEGHATAEGTAEYASGSSLGFTAASGHFRHVAPLGGLTLSSLGTGTYLGAPDHATDEAVENAIVRSVGDGFNVIDSAANYRSGHAEIAVGRALRMMHITGGCKRNHIFVSSKAGYAPSAKALDAVVADGAVPPDAVADSACMHPGWLDVSLNASLKSLQLQTIDLFYLHNVAESFLGKLGPEAFTARLRAAFEFCEAAHKDGTIKFFGMATWSCFRVPPTDAAAHVSMEAVVRLAEEVGGVDHGFRAIQLPANVGMPEAWEAKWQEVGGEAMTAVEAAARLGLAVFTSAPLKERALLRDRALEAALEGAVELSGVGGGTGPRLVQLARSAPGVATALVGHKTPGHVEANLALTKVAPLGAAAWAAALGKVKGA